jgi:MFS family permease
MQGEKHVQPHMAQWRQSQMQENSADASPRAAFGYPNFRFYLGVRWLTSVASEMQSVAVGWQLYSITHRPLDLGLAGLAQFFPGICLFLFAGHIADRVQRQRILQTCMFAFSICSGLLLFFTLRHGTASNTAYRPYAIYAILLLNGVIRAFNAPANSAFLPLVVPRAVFPNAVAWTSSAFQTATIGGPMIGGLLYGFTGSPMYVYICAAGCYLSAFFLLSALQLAPWERSKTRFSMGVVLDGLRYIKGNKLILGAISLDLFAVLLGGAVALLPVYARGILDVGATGLGLMRSAPGVGAVLMGITLAHYPLRRKAGAAMLCCVFAFGIFTVAFGLSRSFFLSLAMLFLIGASDTVSVVVRSTMIQMGTPDEVRGRVSAVTMVFVGASNEVGQFESGLTAQWLGPVPAVVLGGIGTMLVVGTWAWLFPALRRMDVLNSQPAPVAAAQAVEKEAVN